MLQVVVLDCIVAWDVVVCCRTWLLVMLQKALPWFMLYLALVLLARLNQCIELVLLQGMDLSIAGFYQCMLCTASSSCGLTLLI